ncbi:replication initiation factor domain-containing protein [Enterococcus faecalis]|uniref:replication initiation factor domain-containing protein n=1 Tax=Enterococcus faecalis TaxID=1351 RepID=UPI00288C8D32|nr:replication initiation factor domain-containing protein [Enterococcus faecalis]MDT2225180.1 replication initiation factor domain-containing protein [Enterococcus faecalis]
MSVASKPPLTNRGATLANEEKTLRFLIDWCQVTIKEMTVEEICVELLNIPFELMRDDERNGIKGYHASYCYDDIRILESSGKNADNGIQLLMSGSGCRNYEVFLEANNETWFDFLERALKFGSNIPRLDIAIDDFKTYFKIATLKRMAKKGYTVGRSKIGAGNDSFAMSDGERKGETLNIGSRSSDFFMVFYEKNYEQANKFHLEEPLDKWNRYELRFKKKKAIAVAQELVQTRRVDEIALSILKQQVRFVVPPKNGSDKDKHRWPVWQPWEWFLKDVSQLKLSVEPKEKSLEQLYGWLSLSVAPSLWVVRELDRMCGTRQLSRLIDNANVTEKHRKMLENYLKQMERLKIHKYRLEEREHLEYYE